MSASRCWLDVARAIRDGDTAALERLFEVDIVRQEVDATETAIAAAPHITENRHGYCGAWYNKKGGLFRIAVKYDQLDVLAWFYAPTRLAYMHATLSQILVLVVELAVKVGKLELLEFLLESPSWSELLSVAQRQQVLDELPDIFSQEPSEDMIQILLAHGMDINSGSFHEVCAEKFTASQIDLIVAEGVFAVGSGTLARCGIHGNYSATRQLLHYGADVSSPALFLAVDWNADFEMARILVVEGYADVDEQLPIQGQNQDPKPQPEDPRKRKLRSFLQGRTPLISAAAKAFDSSGVSQDNTIVLMRMLLNYGADVSTRDDAGKTVLHHAYNNVHTLPLRMLLESGADPNARSHDGHLVIGRKPVFTEQQIASLSVLLEYGFNPFAIAHDGISSLERLLKTEHGAAFVEAHPEHFTRPSHED